MYKHSFKLFRSFAALVGVVLAALVLFHSAPVHAQGAIGEPVRIEIPSIRVNAAVHSVGRTADGSMDVPRHARDVAWYMQGPKPGQTGSAVMNGHKNWLWEWLFGSTGVFARLHTLKPGDKILVQDEQGVTTSFVVRESRSYNHDEDASDVFYSYDGESHLNLITCSGIWNRVTKAYPKRIVVFADKVEE